MRLTWLWGRRFSRRLTLLALLSALAPMVAVGLAVQALTHRLPSETRRVLAEGRQVEWQRGEAVIRGMIESAIQEKAQDVALQLSLYLQAHPDRTLEDLKRDADFRDIALQPVGQTGYTALHDCRTTIVHFHPSPSVVGVRMMDTEKQFPKLCGLFRAVMNGGDAAGYYTWRTDDGTMQDKYLHLASLEATTADGIRLCVAATTTVDEFTQPLKAAQKVSAQTTRHVTTVVGSLLRGSRDAVLMVMGIGLIGVLVLSWLGGRHLSKIVTQLREATHRVNQGDYDVRVTSPMMGEVDDLVHDFNRMVDHLSATTVRKEHLEQSQRDLSRANRNLRAQIEERNRIEAELRDTNERMIDALNRERRTSLQLQAAMEQLEAASREALAANSAKSEFLANMSHEIRTPLTAILGFADLLCENIEGEDQRAAAQTIQRSGRHLLALINDILDLSKIESGHMELDDAECSIVQVIEETVDMVRQRADHKGLTLTLAHESPLPETVRSDRTRLRQALVNLLGNAVKFTDQGSVDVRSRLIEDRSEPLIEIEVRDTGIGIPQDKLTTIFEPFSQADASTTRKYGGTGLGLAVTCRIAQLLGGRVTVDSEPGTGSTFTLEIPTGPLEGVKRYLPDSTEARTLSTDAVEPKHRQLDCKVLLVEDGPDNRRLITMMLTKAGVELDVAENGRVGMDKALSSHYDVVLMDMQMPVMDGYEATRSLRAAGYDRPILALTAHAMRGDEDQCLEAGCDAYISKPVDRGVLVESVSAWLGKTSDRSRPSNAPDAGEPRLPPTASILSPTDQPGTPAAQGQTTSDLEAFVRTLPQRLEELWQAWHAQDGQLLSELAQRLDHESKASGLSELDVALAHIDQASRQDLLDEAARDLASLNALIAEVMHRVDTEAGF